MLETLEAVYIYIYIVKFNSKENVNIDKKLKLCILVVPKIHSIFVLLN